MAPQKAVTAKDALVRLRRLTKKGPLAVSYTGLAGRFPGWNYSRAYRAVHRWEAGGNVIVERNGREMASILALPDTAKSGGTGVARLAKPAAKRLAKRVAKPAADDGNEKLSIVQNQPSIPNTYATHFDGTDAEKSVPPKADISPGNATVSDPPRLDQDTAKMWPFPKTKPTPIPASVAPASSPVAKYNMSYDGAVPSTYAEHLNFRPVPKASTVAARSPGFDLTNALHHASWPEKLFLLIALGLSGTAAYISVYYGMTVLFPAAGTTILVLGGFIEAAKFLGFGVVSAGWSSYSWFGKWVVAGLLVLAAVVNAAAVYGWLIASHAGPAATRSATHAQQNAGQSANVEVAQGKLSDIDKQIARMDGDISAAQKTRQNNTAERLRQQRKQLSAERDKAQREVSSQNAGRATTTASHQIDEATMLPIKYAAMLFEDFGVIKPGTDPEKLMRWLAFMILLTADPLALAAMFMVNSRARRAA
jgi:hypothetical protein